MTPACYSVVEARQKGLVSMRYDVHGNMSFRNCELARVSRDVSERNSSAVSVVHLFHLFLRSLRAPRSVGAARSLPFCENDFEKMARWKLSSVDTR